jgi:hypothetical protein
MADLVSNPPRDLLIAAGGALKDAERCLRESAAKAAETGDYDALEVLTRWARAVQAMVTEASRRSEETLPKSAPQHEHVSSLRRTTGQRRSAGRVRPVVGEPMYSRDSDMLVKTARSRKSRNDYEHRAPADVVFTLAECVSVWRPNQKLLTGDQILGSYEKKKGSVISYQVYAALGWFTQLGLVRRHGRSGYSVPQPNTVVGDVQKAWDSLKSGQNQ